ncbi:hypothetical protein ACFLUD_02460 [Chloroflexota bacterium]
MVSKSIGVAIRIVVCITFIGCLVCSFVLWRSGEPLLGGVVLFVGLGVFFLGGIVLMILQKIHKKGVYTHDAWQEQATEENNGTDQTTKI